MSFRSRFASVLAIKSFRYQPGFPFVACWCVALAVGGILVFASMVQAAEVRKSDSTKTALNITKRAGSIRNASKLEPQDFAGIKFKRMESDHFVLLSDGGQDPATYLANAEESYAYLCRLIPDLDDVLSKLDKANGGEAKQGEPVNHLNTTPEELSSAMNTTGKNVEKKEKKGKEKTEHVNLRITNGKMLLVAVNDEHRYKQVGEWYRDNIIKGDEGSLAHYNTFFSSSKWYCLYLLNDSGNTEGAGYIYGFILSMPLARGEVSSLLIHNVATLAFSFYSYLRHVPYLFSFYAGMGYRTELALTGESQTFYMDAYSYSETQGRGLGKGSIQVSKTFDAKKAWAKTVKQIIARGNAKIPDVGTLIKLEIGNATPEMNGYLFALMSFLTKDVESCKKFTAFLGEAKEGETLLPTLIKAYGFSGTDEMKKRYVEYMKSKDFQ
ncbi:MAG: hypothetical protein A2283_14630 [Lentisphaerae bacterium RIFOXYA12_FULL_48_11]|nr:MAG: hypothetical protein A2283_14630 [Lentisphaerae bacterium RIFOXYA12_FULL_48_11]